jgi:hypothetical protein
LRGQPEFDQFLKNGYKLYVQAEKK